MKQKANMAATVLFGVVALGIATPTATQAYNKKTDSISVTENQVRALTPSLFVDIACDNQVCIGPDKVIYAYDAKLPNGTFWAGGHGPYTMLQDASKKEHRTGEKQIITFPKLENGEKITVNFTLINGDPYPAEDQKRDATIIVTAGAVVAVLASPPVGTGVVLLGGTYMLLRQPIEIGRGTCTITNDNGKLVTTWSKAKSPNDAIDVKERAGRDPNTYEFRMFEKGILGNTFEYVSWFKVTAQ